MKGLAKQLLSLCFRLFLSTSCTLILTAPVKADSAGETTVERSGYEATIGVTSRTQTLIVFEGRGDRRLAVMTGNFVPSPQLYLTTPFHPFGQDVPGGQKGSRFGYFWTYSFNSFSLHRQEDPDTGGIGSASPVYDYGTRVRGDFVAIAPVIATQTVGPDGAVLFRLELGLGIGYLSLSGDAVLGDQAGVPDPVRSEVDYRGPALFLFTMGRHYWGSFMFGYQLGIVTTSSTPYSFSQSYLSLDAGYRIRF